MASHTTSSSLDDQQSDATLNDSRPEGCIEVRFSRWEYLPWNNPDSIVSREGPMYVSQVRNNMLMILFLIGGPANVINMAVFFKQGLRERVNLLLFSLSLADELCLVSNMFSYAEEFYLQSTGDRKVSPMLVLFMNNRILGFQGFCFVSFVLSTIIACERCYCVLRPLTYHTVLTTRTVALIIVAVYGIVLGLFFLVVSRYNLACFYDPDTGIVSTYFSHSHFYKRHKDLIDYTDSIVFGAGLQIGVVLVVVTATVITTSKLWQAVAWRRETAKMPSSVSPKEVGLTKMLIGVSVLLIVCISPVCVFRLVCVFLPELSTGRRNENFYMMCIRIGQIFTFVNSSFNICIYYKMGSRYRETFWTLFKRK